MRRFLLFIVTLPILTFLGCSKDDDGGSQTIMLNAYCTHTSISEKKIAAPTLVLLYDYHAAQNIDLDKSVLSMADDQKITLKDGTKPAAKYTSSPNFTGINTFENVVNGEYMAIIFYKPEGYSFPAFFFYGYKKITAKSSNKLSMYECVFKWTSDDSDSGHFVEF